MNATIALLCVLNLGSPQYRVRHEASKTLCAMPWAEPMLRSHMKDSLEVYKRSEVILKTWVDRYAPRYHRYYVFANGIKGYVHRIEGDLVWIVHVRRLEPFEFHDLAWINWKEVSFKEVAK